MLLKNLINNLPAIKKNIKITGLTANSKKIKKGFIFFAIRGNKENGEKFIYEAVRKGASVIICSKKCKYVNDRLTVIKTSNIRKFLSEISSRFYKIKPKRIIAVTGTNGKTSVADLFYQILNLNNVSVASIGTLGVKYKKKLIKSNLTSPDTISLHQILQKLKKNRIDNVIIEASSHGLHQKRLDHLNLEAGIFTNFSQDHLDYHMTMKSYFNSKMLLFKKILPKRKTIITDRFIKEFSILKNVSKKKKCHLVDVNLIRAKIDPVLNSKFNEFQLKNLSMAIAAAKLCNITENKILKVLPQIKDINGRLELTRTFTNNIKVFIDFAHTPDALKKSLQFLRDKYNKKITLVFGCGGDRDFKKRAIMAKIASVNCNNIYVTDDNPRNESPEKIRKDIIRNIKNSNYFNIGNRSKAIKQAILNADPNEVILVAGKGHEEEQIYKNKTILISDKKIIKKIKVSMKKLSIEKQTFTQNKKIINEIKKMKYIKNFQGLSIDTRTLKKNNLFLTLKGKDYHGSKFISYAIKKGAKYIITSKNENKFKKKIIKVKNETKFLNTYARKKREISTAKIFAITGSAGKTSLKNLLKELLKKFGRTLSSPKSYNNHFGVPLSLSQLNAGHKYGIFEIGMSKSGEINTLSKLVKPHIGIITNVGEAHIENFKNLKGIAEAKGELINNIAQNGSLILNRDDKFFPFFQRKAKLKSLKLITYGMHKKSDVYPVSLSKKNGKTRMIVKIKKQTFSLFFKNLNIYNILSSLALLSELNLNLKKAIKLFDIYEPSPGRGKIYQINRYNKKFSLIDESYNANPLSVKNAVKNFNTIKKSKFKKYLLLGDMLELGNRSEELHRNLSKVINNSDIDKIFVKGNKTLVTYKNVIKEKRGNIFQQDEDVDFTFNNIIANNDYLMIKGSNATGLGNISKRMIKGN